MFGRFTSAILSRRFVALASLVLFVGAVAGGIWWLRADFSVKMFFGQADVETEYLTGYLERWGEDDLLLIVVDGGDEGLLTRERLTVVDDLAGRLEGIEGVSKVMSVTRVPRVSRGFAGAWIPVPLMSQVPRDGEEDGEAAQAWREQLLSDARLVPSYLSADGRFGVVMVALGVDTSDLTAVRPVVHAVEAMVEDVAAGELSYKVAGVPAIRAHILDVIVRDQVLFVPISGTIIAVLLFLLFRSRHGVLIPSVAAGVPLIMLLGLMGWCGESINLINQSFLALVPAIAVADAIHLVSRFHEESRRLVADGRKLTAAERDDAIVRAMSYMGVACFLTSFTTIVGFLSLLQTDLPVLRNYGLYAAVGVGLAYFTVLFIVPLALLGTRSGARRLNHGAEGLLGTTLEYSAWATTKHPWTCMGAAVLVTVCSLWMATYVKVDTKVTQTFYDHHPTTQANHLVDEHLGGVLAYEFDLKAEPGTFDKPEVLDAMRRLGERAETYDTVRTSLSVASVLQATSVLLGGKDDIPENPAIVQRLYKVNASSGVMDALVSEDRANARLLIRTTDSGAIAFLSLGEELEVLVEEELAPLGISSRQTGSSFVAYRGMSRVTSDLRDSLIAAFGVIGVIIAVLFSDVWLGALSLLPNVLPLLVGYGMMGMTGMQLEAGPAVVFTIAVGVSVDSAIHVIARFREERQAGRSVDDSVRESIFHSGRAVMITAIILSIGFAANIHSSSPATASFGRVGTVIILAALMSNLFVLPAMLKLGLGETGIRRSASK